MKRVWVGIIAVLLFLSACQAGEAGKPVIEVEDAWVRAAMMMGGTGSSEGGHSGMGEGGINTAAYMVLVNKGMVADRLLRVEGGVAKAIELHRSEVVDGVMKMSPVDAIEIPANGKAELKPGGLHIMLIGITQDLKAGDQVELVLVFEKAGKVTIQVEVRAP